MEEAARTGPSVVEAVDFDEAEGALVVSLRPKARERGRCRICRRHSPGYALGEGHRRRRTLDLGTTLCFLEAEAPRVECQTTGWSSARCRGRATTRSSRAARGPDRLACGQHLQDSGAGEVHSQLMRIAWRTVDWICARVMAEASAERGLRRIGVDEISVRRGQRYLAITRWSAIIGLPDQPRQAARTFRRTHLPQDAPSADDSCGCSAG